MLQVIALLSTALLICEPKNVAQEDVDYVGDVRFALAQLETECGHFFKLKQIEWKKVSRTFLKQSKEVETPEQHGVLLRRLLARLKDGHAKLRLLEAGQQIQWPDRPETTGPGMFWCRSGKKILVKSVWSAARDSGVEAGMQVLTVDGVKVDKWLDQRIEHMRDEISFSTDQQAFFYTCHWGLAGEIGTRMKLELKDA